MKRKKTEEWIVDNVEPAGNSNSKFNSKGTKMLKKKQKVQAEDTTEEIHKIEDAEIKRPRKRKKSKKGKIQTMCKDENKEKCINYLKKWHTDRQNWKFEKLRQIWLLKNMFNNDNVPDLIFPILLEYISGTRGHARKMVVENAMNMIKAMEKWQELVEDGLSEEEISTELVTEKVTDEKYQRARLIIQSLDDV